MICFRNRYLRLISDAFGKNFMGIVQQVESSAKLVCRQIKNGVSIDILLSNQILKFTVSGWHEATTIRCNLPY